MKITVPLRIASPYVPLDENKALEELRKLDASAVAFTLVDVNDPDFIVSELNRLIPFFEKNGVETRLWMGGSLMHFTYPGKSFQRRVGIDGKEQSGYCPLDDNFTDYFCKILEKFFSTGIKTVFFDDDFRINFWTGKLQCFCPLHRKYQSELLREETDISVLREKLLTGKPNKYRAAWQKANADSLTAFARKIRRTADRTDEKIRLGTCTSHAIWGTDAWVKDIVYALAGTNKPLIRFWGAPYSSGCIATSIECERMELEEFDGEDIEIMAEGDTYPRPRYLVSSALLECFHTALIAADGKFDLLKYALDYNSSLKYETGYADKAEKNKEIYARLGEMFKAKDQAGFCVYEALNKISEREFREDFTYRAEEIMSFPSIKILTDNSLSVSHKKGKEPYIVFGENAKYVTEEMFSNGMVLDVVAAGILERQGVDVGLAADEGKIDVGGNALYEHYLKDDEYVWLPNACYEKITLKEGAETLSESVCGADRYQGAYRYENVNGSRFVVLPFDAEKNMNALAVFRSYSRQEMLEDAYMWLCGREYIAVCNKNPDLFMLVKTDGKNTAVGLWNFSQDSIDEVKVKMRKKCKVTRTVRCEAVATDDTVKTGKLSAFEFMAFETEWE